MTDDERVRACDVLDELPQIMIDRDRRAEYVWLADHAAEYLGKWVALLGSDLVAVSSSLKDLLQKVRLLPGLPLLHHIANDVVLPEEHHHDDAEGVHMNGAAAAMTNAQLAYALRSSYERGGVDLDLIREAAERFAVAALADGKCRAYMVVGPSVTFSRVPSGVDLLAADDALAVEEVRVDRLLVGETRAVDVWGDVVIIRRKV